MIEPIYKTSIKAKHISIRIKGDGDGDVIVTIPPGGSEKKARVFFESKRAWVEKMIRRIEGEKVRAKENKDENGLIIQKLKKVKHNAIEKRILSKEAMNIVKEKIDAICTHYKVNYKNIFIKDTTTRWGSCSAQKNLNFCYKIVFLPEDLQYYLLVHEVCHLREMNHSEKFWNLVAECVPGHKEARKRMRRL